MQQTGNNIKLEDAKNTSLLEENSSSPSQDRIVAERERQRQREQERRRREVVCTILRFAVGDHTISLLFSLLNMVLVQMASKIDMNFQSNCMAAFEQTFEQVPDQ